MSEPADLTIDEPGKRGGGPVSLVWLVPLIALAIALYIVWQAYSSRGPVIEITFESAEGVTPDSTVLKYRDVNVGVVEDIHFTSDLQGVVVSVRVDKDIAHFIDSDAEFWIVRPQVTARGVTGLTTVLGGVYLEGTWDATPGSLNTRFEGLPRAPLVRHGAEGVEITLRALEGGRLHAGAPIVYRGVDVGYIDTPELAADGQSVTARGFIEAPHDELVTAGTRFWATSGFSVQLGASGLEVDVASMAALLEGGISFDKMSTAGGPVENGTVFDVYEDQESARSNALALDMEGGIAFSAFFDNSIAGLTAGAPVEFEGLEVGTVTGLGIDLEDQNDSEKVLLRADLSILPGRLGLEPEDAGEATHSFIADAVSRGLRARLASDGLFSQSLKVELVVIPDAQTASLDENADPAPAIPTADANISDVAESARGVLARLQDLPIERLVDNVSNLLASVDEVVSSDDVRKAPGAIVRLIEEARGVIGSAELRDAISATGDSVTELRQILSRVNESPAVAALLAALERTEQIAANVESATQGMPQLVDDIRSITAKADSLPIEDLVSSADELVQSANALVSSDDTARIPAALSDALDELAATLDELRAGGAVQNVNETLASASAAADAIAEAAEGLPALTARLDRLILSSEAVLNTYGDRSEFNAQTLSAIRDLRDAARAVTSLARTIERKPNSLILGR